MSDMHPPANRRCQIYITGPWSLEAGSFQRINRCDNDCTHWAAWGGSDTDFHSWECDGDHTFKWNT